jgi:hypothetical protein
VSSLSACTKNYACRDHTLFLSLNWPGSVQNADSFLVSVAVAGGSTKTTVVPRGSSTGSSIEIDFNSYPVGKHVTVTVQALKGGSLISSVSGVIQLSGTCVAAALSAGGPAVGDISSSIADMSLEGPAEDLAPQVTPDLIPAIATARPLAPFSFATVTLRQPKLQWILTPGVGTPTVDLCKDRLCTQPLSVTATVEASKTSAHLSGPLPQSSWVYWRVRVQSGVQAATSPTWQFWVGQSSASTNLDTSNGITLDVNGDGYADFIVGTLDAVVHVYLGGASASATWNQPMPSTRIDLTSPESGKEWGSQMAAVGDVNGDGYGDFLIDGNTGAHLYLGGPTPSTSTWNGPNASMRVDLADPDVTESVGGAGDVDGDGYADFLVGHQSANSGSGIVHLFFGSPNPTASTWSASNRLDLTNPDGNNAAFGNGVTGGTDVNGDGFADFFVGSSTTNAHVYLGHKSPTAGDWNGTTPQMRIDLTSPDGARFAGFPIPVGDINNDGYGDLTVSTGVPGGAVYLYLGKAQPTQTDWNGASPMSRLQITNPDGANSAFGSIVVGGTDIDQDGFTDFVIGAVNANSATGAAHVYYGAATLSSAGLDATRFDLTSPDQAAAGFAWSALAVGDIDGDGFGDFMVSTSHAASDNGAAHVYLGLKGANAANWNGATPTKRVDLSDPDGAGARFGYQLAFNGSESPGCGGATSVFPRVQAGRTRSLPAPNRSSSCRASAADRAPVPEAASTQTRADRLARAACASGKPRAVRFASAAPQS